MASPAKPWERNGHATTATAASGISSTTLPPTTNASSLTAPGATTTTSSTTPAIPDRPASLTSAVNQNAAAYSRPYGAYSTGYNQPYTSPYNRYGGGYGTYGGMGYGAGGMYGSYGGYGGMYGAGGGMYGMGPGMPGDPNDPNSLTNRFNQGTQATFQMLEGVVGAFGGFAQMLESTYMATHSSFFAMVAVAEQFGNLRDTLGSVLGIFTLIRWIRTLLAKLTGRPPPVDTTALTPAAFARFEGRQQPPTLGPDGRPVPTPAKPSRKPLLFFLLAAFGLPYVMSKLIRSLAASHEEEERKRQAAMALEQQAQLDPSKLEFCRVLYDFSPSTLQNAQGGGGGGEMVPGVDLQVAKGDLVAVLGKTDPLGNPSEWWRCRARDGRVGYLPATFLEVLQRNGGAKTGNGIAAIQSGSAASSRANSLRAQTITSETAEKMAAENGGTVKAPNGHGQANGAPKVVGKVGDISAESFQKSQFYS